MARVPGREPKQAPQEELSEEDAMPPAEETDVPEDGEDVAEENQGAALPTEDDYEEPEGSGAEEDTGDDEAEYDDDRSAQYEPEEEDSYVLEGEPIGESDPRWRPSLRAVQQGLKDAIYDESGNINPDIVQNRSQGNTDIDYIPWYIAQDEFDFYTYGFWNYRIVEKRFDGDDFLMTVEVEIECREGTFTREATGIEKVGDSGYGDFQSGAESMALRRGFAKFGLGLDLYR